MHNIFNPKPEKLNPKAFDLKRWMSSPPYPQISLLLLLPDHTSKLPSRHILERVIKRVRSKRKTDPPYTCITELIIHILK